MMMGVIHSRCWLEALSVEAIPHPFEYQIDMVFDIFQLLVHKVPVRNQIKHQGLNRAHNGKRTSDISFDVPYVSTKDESHPNKVASSS